MPRHEATAGKHLRPIAQVDAHAPYVPSSPVQPCADEERDAESGNAHLKRLPSGEAWYVVATLTFSTKVTETSHQRVRTAVLAAYQAAAALRAAGGAGLDSV